jgi:3',5'-cyclic-AMP phosphodiesterase
LFDFHNWNWWGGTLAYSAPSTAWQYALDLRGDRALAKTQEPPGFALHIWTGESMVAHTRLVQP